MKRMAGRAFAACVIAACAFAASATTTAQAAAPQAEPGLGAAQIIEKNAAARGGVDAWRKVLTMAWSGRVETGNAARPTMPFVLEQKRPDKTRFEITFDQQKSLRIFDGTEGWKLRPSSSGRPETVAYTADEASYAREAQVVDGPLMDCAAKGYPVTLEGLDEVEGRKAYRLNARLPSGALQTVWVDAETFLDLRLDRMSKNSAGRPFMVSVYYRNYKAFEGLQIPLTLETHVAGASSTDNADRIVIERIALNPTLEDSLFSKPKPQGVRRGVVVDTRAAALEARPVPQRANGGSQR